MKNDYYEIAYNNLCYLEGNLHRPFYNEIAVSAQQITEKMLKSVLNEIYLAQDLEIDKLMHSRNLRGLYDKIAIKVSNFKLDRGALSILKDYYFDAKYPGDNFVTVSKEECQECIEIMYNTIEMVNRFREQNGLGVKECSRKSIGINYLDLF